MNGIISVLLFLIVINGFSYLLMGLDKEYAKNRSWRISEQFLLSMALLGGSIGIYIGMFHYRHKTKKPLFMVGVPIIFVIELILALTYGLPYLHF